MAENQFIARKGLVSLDDTQITGSLGVTGAVTASTFIGDGSQLTGVDGAATASYVEYTNIANLPTLVSGSSQITYSGLTGIPLGIVSASAQIADLGFATTGSNSFDGSQVVTGSLTVTGDIVAQTLNVQQVTSSVVYSSGSNIFGNSLANTHEFTGSISVTGSLTVNGTAVQPLLTNPITGTGTSGQVSYWNGTNTQTGGDLTWDNGNRILQTTGSGTLRTSTGNLTLATAGGNGNILLSPNGTGNVGIGLTNPLRPLHLRGTPTEFGNSRSIIYCSDSTTAGLGVGGGIIFSGNALSNQTDSLTVFGGIQGVKENSTIGNVAGALVLLSRPDFGQPTERMRIDSIGLVGIGTDVPTNRLDINGTTRIRTINNGTGDFLTRSGTGVVTHRTAAQVLTDIGAAATSHTHDASAIISGDITPRIPWAVTNVEAFGSFLGIGSGSDTVVASGEALSTYTSQFPVGSRDVETLWLLSDQNIIFRSNLQNGWGSGIDALSIANTGLLTLGVQPTNNTTIANYDFLVRNTGNGQIQRVVNSLIGWSFFTTASPSAIRYVRTNANNTITFIEGSTLRTEIGAQPLLTNPITGTGTAGQVSFWNGTNTQGGDSGLVWDNTNKRLGIGTNAPLYKLQVTNVGGVPSTSSVASIQNDGASFEINITSAATGTALIDLLARSGGSGNVSTAGFTFSTRNAGTISEKMRLTSGGDVLIGTTTALTGGGRLQVNGAANITADSLINGLTVGRGAGNIDTNTVLGNSALQSNSTGSNNVAVGRNALRDNTLGLQNSAVGQNTLVFNTTGNNNTAVGQNALNLNTTGNNNTAVGQTALVFNTTGGSNVGISVDAGRRIANGSNLTVSDNSIFIGQDTRANADNQTNQIVIGHEAVGIGSNSVVLGNTDIATTVLRGNVGIGTTTPAASAILELSATNRALLLTRLTSTQRDALTAVNGMIIYNSTTNKIQARANGSWVDLH